MQCVRPQYSPDSSPARASQLSSLLGPFFVSLWAVPPGGLSGSSPLHVEALVRPLGIVADQVLLKILLHLLLGFIELLATLDALYRLWFLGQINPAFSSGQSRRPHSCAFDLVAVSSFPAGPPDLSLGFPPTRLIDLWRCKLHCPQQILPWGACAPLQPPKLRLPVPFSLSGLTVAPTPRDSDKISVLRLPYRWRLRGNSNRFTQVSGSHSEKDPCSARPPAGPEGPGDHLWRPH